MINLSKFAVFANIMMIVVAMLPVCYASGGRPPVEVSFDHTYDQLGACGRLPYVSDKQARQCLNKAIASDPESKQSNGPAGVFYGTVNNDLGEWVESRILRVNGNKTELRVAYHAWMKRTISSCEATSQFGLGGSGQGADIGYCTAAAQIVLLQKNLDFQYKQSRHSK